MKDIIIIIGIITIIGIVLVVRRGGDLPPVLQPELPVQITTRTSLATGVFGKKSHVLQFTNLSDSHLSLTLFVTAVDGNSNSWTFDLMPHQRNKEIGVMETDWAFEPGERVEIQSKGYRPFNTTLK